MKQIASTYTYNKTSGVISLTGVNIDRDQLLLIVNTTRNVTYYNFADSATTLQAFTQGANTSVTLASSVISASSTHTNADALTIYYDDQVNGSGTVTANVPLSFDGYTATTGIRVIGTGTDGTLRIQGIDPSLAGNPPANLEEGGKIPVFGTVTANVFGQDWEEHLTLYPNIENFFGEGNGGVGLLAVGGQSYTNPINIPPIHVVGTVTATPAQGTTVTNSNFTSITPSTSLVSAVAGRRVLSVFNEGSGLLFISAGLTCTTSSYSVRLSAGDYWECPQGQLSLAHSGAFGTAGTARITQVV